MKQSSLEILERNRSAQFLVALAAVLALKWNTLVQLPVWDSAMGLFPAAITLAGNGLDLFELAGMEEYRRGGPNVHGFSPVTLATAVVLRLTGGGSPGLVVLHLLHFSVAALSLAVLFRLARPLLGTRTSGLLCLSTLLQPVFSAQVGFLYLEVPLFLCAVSALDAWSNRRLGVAIVWSTLAFAIKQTGIIVPAMLAFASLMERDDLRARLTRILWIALPPILLAGLLELMGILATRDEPGRLLLFPHTGFTADRIVHYIAHYADRFLLGVPDLALFLGLFLILTIVHGPKIVAALRREPREPSERNRRQQELLVLGLSGMLIAIFLILSYGAFPAIARYAIVLPRYHVVILPFLLLWIGYGLRKFFPRRASAPAIGLGALAAVFAVNTNGVLYPPDVDTEGPGNDPALTERSNAYRRLQALELEAVHFLEGLPDDAWVYYGHYEHYLFSYPEMGWVEAPLANGHNLFVEPLPNLEDADAYPPCVYVLYNYPWAGGRRLRVLLERTEGREDFSTTVVRTFRDAPYQIVLHRIRRGDADCPV